MVQRPGAIEHLRLDRGVEVALLVEVAASARVVADGEDELLAHADAPHVVLEVDELLERHHQRAALVVGAEQLAHVVHPADVLPPSPVRGLEDGGEADVAGDGLPVERVLEVPEAALRVDGRDVRLRGEQHRPRHRHPDARGERVAKELLVRAPPERVVDDVRARERGRLEVEPVERDLVADPVDEDPVAGLERLRRAADAGQLGLDARMGVDPGDERLGKALLLANEDSDPLRHDSLPRERKVAPHRPQEASARSSNSSMLCTGGGIGCRPRTAAIRLKRSVSQPGMSSAYVRASRAGSARVRIIRS